MIGKPLNLREPQLTLRVNMKVWIRRLDHSDLGFAMMVRKITPITGPGMAWSVECTKPHSGPIGGDPSVFIFNFHASGLCNDDAGTKLSVVRFKRAEFDAAKVKAATK